jgi:hypothetical protein
VDLDPRNIIEEGKKRREIVGRGDSEGKSMCNSGVLNRTKKESCFGCNNFLAAFSIQYYKRDYRGDK